MAHTAVQQGHNVDRGALQPRGWTVMFDKAAPAGQAGSILGQHPSTVCSITKQHPALPSSRWFFTVRKAWTERVVGKTVYDKASKRIKRCAVAGMGTWRACCCGWFHIVGGRSGQVSDKARPSLRDT